MAANPRAVLGDNNPPEATAYEAIKLHIDNLAETAQGFLDGDPITTQAQADDVGRILADAREARAAAEAQRKADAKPFDEGKTAVQALWTPLTDEKKGRCALIAETCKKALAPFLKAQQDAADKAAAEARQIALAKAAQAQAALQSVNVANLAEREAAEALLQEADKASKAADRAGNVRATATGGARAVSLRTVWTASITDRRAALNHYIKVQPDAFAELIQSLADHEARHGPRNAEGVTFSSEQVAQ